MKGRGQGTGAGCFGWFFMVCGDRLSQVTSFKKGDFVRVKAFFAGFVTVSVVTMIACPVRADSCADKALKRHLSELSGWKIHKITPTELGVHVSMVDASKTKTLMLALGFNENGFNTFQNTYGEEGTSGVSDDLMKQLGVIYEAIDNDQEAKNCPVLTLPADINPDQVYAQLEAEFRSFERPQSLFSSSKTGMNVVVVSLVGTLILVGVGLFLVIRRKKAAQQSPDVAQQAADVVQQAADVPEYPDTDQSLDTASDSDSVQS